jgi:hypothetical protein
LTWPDEKQTARASSCFFRTMASALWLAILTMMAVLIVQVAAQQYQKPQYVILNCQAYIDWNQDEPSTITAALVQQVEIIFLQAKLTHRSNDALSPDARRNRYSWNESANARFFHDILLYKYDQLPGNDGIPIKTPPRHVLITSFSP